MAAVAANDGGSAPRGIKPRASSERSMRLTPARGRRRRASAII